jgi:hypothetical protein
LIPKNDILLESLKLSGIEPEDTRGEPLFSKYNDMQCTTSSVLEGTQYLLMPSRILGFALGSKKQWGKLKVDIRVACVLG